jgi:hypothetical protein
MPLFTLIADGTLEIAAPVHAIAVTDRLPASAAGGNMQVSTVPAIQAVAVMVLVTSGPTALSFIFSEAANISGVREVT